MVQLDLIILTVWLNSGYCVPEYFCTCVCLCVREREREEGVCVCNVCAFHVCVAMCIV